MHGKPHDIKSLGSDRRKRHPRVFGLALGALLGLVYGLTSQTINRIILPGIPLYQPPLGPAGNACSSRCWARARHGGGLADRQHRGNLRRTLPRLLTFVSFLSVRLTEKNTSA